VKDSFVCLEKLRYNWQQRGEIKRKEITDEEDGRRKFKGQTDT